MNKKKEYLFLSALIAAVILMLILPISSQKSINIDEECPDLITNGPCAPDNIAYSQRPLIVVLTEEDEFVPMKANNELLRNTIIATSLCVAYVYFSTKEQAITNKRKKSK